MIPPFVSYITFNRLGLTARNLESILGTTEDFEMHIIDNNSKDETWEYIQSLDDPRIKSKTRFSLNAGPIYAVNYILNKRKPEQYFISIDNDVFMKTQNWISCFMEVFSAFPEVGVLGVQRGNPYPEYLPPVIPKHKDGVMYLQLANGKVGEIMDFVPGCCQCLRPELIEEIGYWSEENYYGDAELSPRVNNYTRFKVGFVTNINIDMTQSIDCEGCKAQKWCMQDRSTNTCFSIRNMLYKNELFIRQFEWKYLQTFKELANGERTAYCASVVDPESMNKTKYNMEWASENFDFYIKNAN